ncbi:hypothetical protein [Novosphingobium sp. FKTRR1]|uniref:hypothetical protein n=1 Tax=Novosphingobium sp. FKTRR1 TaxID=2879118 RepID=UPI001CF0A6AE|nr:hypothetical protein [Novosphingobium sp. FKTRR1]
MTFSRIATVLAAASVLATPVVASAATRASVVAPAYSLTAMRHATAVKRKNNALEAGPLLLVAGGLTVATVGIVEVTKSK